jgi:hypothetical protein
MTLNHTEELLDRCISAMLDQGRGAEDCLAEYPAERPELEPLLGLAARLKTAGSLQASPDFKATAAVRLQALADAQIPVRRSTLRLPAFLGGLGSDHPAAMRRNQPRPSPLALFAGLLLAVLILASVGAVVASAQALPGDLLYPIKRAGESVQLSLAQGQASQADLYLQFADRRMSEALSLVQLDRPDGLDQALVDYDAQIQTGMNYFGQASGLSLAEQTGLANKVLTNTSSYETSLISALQQAPQSLRERLAAALATSQKAHSQAVQVIQTLNNNGGNLVVPTATPTPSATPLPPTKPPLSTPGPGGLPPSPTHPPLPGVFPSHTLFPKPTLPPSIKPTGTKPAPIAIPTRKTLTRPPLVATLGRSPTKPAILPNWSPRPTATPRPTLPPWFIP